jgi:RNA polymerase sigma-70 factor (ECF subfamily)
MALARIADPEEAKSARAEVEEEPEEEPEAAGAEKTVCRPVAGEAAIIASVRSGEVDRFRVLVVRYQGKLISTLHRLVGNRAIAEELAQQSFVDAFGALESFDSGRRFSTWLFRIGVNNAKDWLKSHKRGERGLDAAGEASEGAFSARLPDPERAAVSAQEIARLEVALADLPIQFREVVVMKDVHGLSYREIHEVLGHPISTLKIRAVRGRAALRKALETDGPGKVAGKARQKGKGKRDE